MMCFIKKNFVIVIFKQKCLFKICVNHQYKQNITICHFWEATIIQIDNKEHSTKFVAWSLRTKQQM